MFPSPADERRDRVEKMDEYAGFGVRFYWLVDPALGSVEIFDVYVTALGTKEALGAALNWYRANIAPTSAFQDGGGATPPIGPVSPPTMFVWSDGDIAICEDGAVLTADFAEDPGDGGAPVMPDEMEPSSCQRTASSYFDVFIQPDSEDQSRGADSPVR